MNQDQAVDLLANAMKAALGSPMAAVEVHRACVARGVESDHNTLMSAVHTVSQDKRHWHVRVSRDGERLFETTPLESAIQLDKAMEKLLERFPPEENWTVRLFETLTRHGQTTVQELDPISWGPIQEEKQEDTPEASSGPRR